MCDDSINELQILPIYAGTHTEPDGQSVILLDWLGVSINLFN